MTGFTPGVKPRGTRPVQPVDGFLGRDVEFVRSLEIVGFEGADEFIVIIWCDDEIEVGREASLELTNRVATDQYKRDIRRLEFGENLDESLASFFVARVQAGSMW